MHVEVYVYSGDNDTLSCTVTGRLVGTDTWDTLYSGSGGSRTVLNTDYTGEYDQIRVQLNDTENNDTIYYTWDYTYY